jgi:CheY-like chemotaxis protein
LLECDSAPGRGATFTLLLSGARPDARHPASGDSDPVRPFAGRAALVIDDEPAVRRTLTTMLELLGLTAMGAASGVEGVELAASSPVDVVFLDYSMPGQLPEETLKQLCAARPGVPVICCSGLAVDLAGATAVLAKPFGLADLSSVLSRVLESERA